MIDIDEYDFLCNHCWTALLSKNMESWSGVLSSKQGTKCKKCGNKLDPIEVRRSKQLEYQVIDWITDLSDKSTVVKLPETSSFFGKVDGDIVQGSPVNPTELINLTRAMGKELVVEMMYRGVINHFFDTNLAAR